MLQEMFSNDDQMNKFLHVEPATATKEKPAGPINLSNDESVDKELHLGDAVNGPKIQRSSYEGSKGDAGKEFQDMFGAGLIQAMPFDTGHRLMGLLKSWKTGRPYEEEYENAKRYTADTLKHYGAEKTVGTAAKATRKVNDALAFTAGAGAAGAIASKVPALANTVSKVAGVANKIPVVKHVFSTNPWQASAATSGITGTVSFIDEKRRGTPTMTALGVAGLDALGAGAYRLLGAYDAPRKYIYTVGAPIEFAKSAIKAKESGAPVDWSDITADAVGNLVLKTEYAKQLAPDKDSNVKGSKNANRADLLKEYANESTESIENQLKDVPDDTPLIEVNTPAIRNLAKGVKRGNPKLASDISMQLERKAKETLKPASEKLNSIEQKILGSGEREIPVSSIDKLAKTGTTKRSTLDTRYNITGKTRGHVAGDTYNSNTLYNAEKDLTDDKQKIRVAGKNAEPELRARAVMRRALSPDAKTAKEWKLADTEFSEAKAKADSLNEMSKAWSTSGEDVGFDKGNITGSIAGTVAGKGEMGLYSLAKNTVREAKDAMLSHYNKGLEKALAENYTVGQFKKALRAKTGNALMDSTISKDLGPAASGLYLEQLIQKSIRDLPKKKYDGNTNKKPPVIIEMGPLEQYQKRERK